MNPSPLLYFIAEREAIRRRRVAGEPQPFTDDPILREWSFTNVRREDDRVTKWITKNWREPHADDPDLFFELAVARFVNWPDTLAEIGYPVPWNPEHFLTVMAARAERGDQLAGPAYMIRADKQEPGQDHGGVPSHRGVQAALARAKGAANSGPELGPLFRPA